MDALAFYDFAGRHADAVRHEHQFGELLVDRDDRCLDPAVGVADVHQVHHALHRAVLARRPVERVEHHVGFELGQPLRDIMVHVELGDVGPAPLAQRLGHPAPAGQRDFALARPAAHQDDDVQIPVHVRPTR